MLKGLGGPHFSFIGRLHGERAWRALCEAAIDECLVADKRAGAVEANSGVSDARVESSKC